MIAMAGLAARLQTLIDLLNGTVMSAIREVPWDVTALPTPQVAATSNTYGYGAQANGAANTTLQTLVSVTGSGTIKYAELNSGTTTAVGSLKLVVTVDGVDLVDHTEASVAAGTSIIGVGRKTGAGLDITNEWDVPFRSSLVIKAQQGTARNMFLRYTMILADPHVS